MLRAFLRHRLCWVVTIAGSGNPMMRWAVFTTLSPNQIHLTNRCALQGINARRGGTTWWPKSCTPTRRLSTMVTRQQYIRRPFAHFEMKQEVTVVMESYKSLLQPCRFINFLTQLCLLHSS